MTLTNRDILAFSAIKGVGPVALSRLVESGYSESGNSMLLPPKIAEALADNSRRNGIYAHADRQFDLAEQAGIEILTKVDRRYPALLSGCSEAPPILYAKGNLPAIDRSTIGIVGTREPTPHGIVATRRLTTFVVEQGYAVVSGLALGCDAVAHEECVRLQKPTVAVLAHGLQTIVPKRNARLAEAILDAGGLWVSEFPIGVEPQPQFFVQRDKTQALLSKAIIMMQSDLNGGSLHASRAALKIGRWLIVAHPTSTDMANHEPKIQANLLLSEGDDRSRADILKCNQNDLSRLFILRGRDEYHRMLELIESAPTQERLLI